MFPSDCTKHILLPNFELGYKIFNKQPMKSISALVICLLLAISPLLAQTCQVLDSKIASTYTGDCKKELAHGKGEAKGENTYKGEFKNGMKHGEGTYTYANGDVFKGNFQEDQRYGLGEFIPANNPSTAQKGYWKGERLMGQTEENLKGYVIHVAQNVTKKPVLTRSGDGNNIKITIRDINRSVTGFTISEFTSGQLADVNSPNGGIVTSINNVRFPLIAVIQYTVPNKSNNFTLPVLLRLEILEPGNWTLSVSHD